LAVVDHSVAYATNIRVCVKKMLKKGIVGVMLLCIIISSIPLVFAEDANDKQLGVWGIDEYNDYQTDLPYSTSNAINFAYELNAHGWSVDQEYYDNDAIETHWEEADDSSYADSVDVAFFAGHGNYNRIVFGTDNDPGSYSYVCHASEASWGGTDMEWAVFYACLTLDSSYKTTWNQVFDGLHGICGYHTVLHTDSVTGGAAGDEFTSGDSVYDAWVDATMFSGHQDDIAAIYAVIVRIDSVNYDYWDNELDSPLPDYDGVYTLKYGYHYDNWGCT